METSVAYAVKFVCLLIALVALHSTAAAQVKSGDVVSRNNAEKARELLSPGVYWRVQQGMTIKVVPTERIEWPPPYQVATEKYSAQVRLSEDNRSLVGYVAGLPFPLVDANDPYAGVKITWNNSFRPMYTDDLDIRLFEGETLYVDVNHPQRIVENEEIGHYFVYNLVGRTEVAPLPTDPAFKTSGVLFMSAMYPFLAPSEARGKGIIRYRYAEPDKGDNAWMWMPGGRRLRRLNEAFLGTAAGTDQFAPDDYEGFGAKNENYDWRFLAEKTMLGAIDIEHVPANTCPSDGGGSVCPERWQLRRIFVVEGIPRRDRVPEELTGRRVLYLDAEAWVLLYEDVYNRRGELAKNFTNWLAYRDRPVPDARVAVYPYKRLFEAAEAITDVRAGLSEVYYRPSRQTQEKETWYINMGTVDQSTFTLQAMVKAAK
jgi:hypothetical protein